MALLIAVVVTGAVGFGAGFMGIGSFIPAMSTSTEPAMVVGDKPKEEADAATAKDDHAVPAEGDVAEEGERPEPIDPNDVTYAPLPPVVTNLLEPKTVWVRLEGGITYLKSGEVKADVLTGQSAQQIMQYIRTLRLIDLEGRDGLQFLQDDLNDLTHSLSGGQVQSVLISGLIIE